MKKPPFYKKKWFVGTKIQKDLIIYIFSMCLLTQLFFVTDNMAKNNLNNEPLAQYLVYIIQAVYVGYLLYGFWLTNRIAGPLFRLERHMDEVAKGNIDSEISFRKNDYGYELAEAFNTVVKQRVNKSE
jgi:nitrogen fixation/metabolism regulation signal transduction histidine kinase